MRLVVYVDLLTLEFQVCLNDSLNCPHVRATSYMESFHKLSHIKWILPLFDPFEKAKIDQGHCWCPADSRAAMHIHIQTEVVDHVVELRELVVNVVLGLLLVAFIQHILMLLSRVLRLLIEVAHPMRLLSWMILVRLVRLVPILALKVAFVLIHKPVLLWVLV